MPHILNQFFDKIYCINLIDEVDRHNKSQERFDKIGLDVEFFPAIKFGFNPQLLDLFKKNKYIGHDFTFPNEIGCAISHYTCIKQAKYLGYKNVLIFEDDIVFVKGFNNKINLYIDSLPTNWHIMYLYSGIYQWRIEHTWVEGAEGLWYKSFESNGCIAYGINSTFFDYAMGKLDKVFQISDNFFRKQQNTLEFNCYSAFPNLCAQEVNSSTINPDKNNTINVFPYMVSFAGLTGDDYI